MKKFLAIVLFVAAAGVFAGHANAQAVVIANPAVKASDVSTSDLKDVFTGSASTLKDGSKVTPVLLKAGAANDAFFTSVVGKSDAAVKAIWRNLVFSGQAAMPKTVESEAAMVEYVSHTPGAVGYVSKSTPHDGVKVLAVK